MDQMILRPADGVSVDMSKRSFTFRSLPNELAQQNTLRKSLNLPPLPDPATVTDDSPATAANTSPLANPTASPSGVSP